MLTLECPGCGRTEKDELLPANTETEVKWLPDGRCIIYWIARRGEVVKRFPFHDCPFGGGCGESGMPARRPGGPPLRTLTVERDPSED